MSVKIPVHSRLRFGNLYSSEGVEFWDILDLPTVEEQDDDIVYQIKGGVGERIDQLASRFYGDPKLWWVIALANDFELVPVDLNHGDIIIVPAPRYVLQELFQKAGI
jgi:hypothetical protein